MEEIIKEIMQKIMEHPGESIFLACVAAALVYPIETVVNSMIKDKSGVIRFLGYLLALIAIIAIAVVIGLVLYVIIGMNLLG